MCGPQRSGRLVGGRGQLELGHLRRDAPGRSRHTWLDRPGRKILQVCLAVGRWSPSPGQMPPSSHLPHAEIPLPGSWVPSGSPCPGIRRPVRMRSWGTEVGGCGGFCQRPSHLVTPFSPRTRPLRKAPRCPVAAPRWRGWWPAGLYSSCHLSPTPHAGDQQGFSHRDPLPPALKTNSVFFQGTRPQHRNLPRNLWAGWRGAGEQPPHGDAAPGAPVAEGWSPQGWPSVCLRTCWASGYHASQAINLSPVLVVS